MGSRQKLLIRLHTLTRGANLKKTYCSLREDRPHNVPHLRRRKEFAPHIISSSAILAGGFAAMRRGRIAGILGASAAGAVAYGVVYDEIIVDKVPDMIFGRKD